MITTISASNGTPPKLAALTDDPATILQFAIDAFDSGRGAALITLVEIRGGAARGLGSQMAVDGDGGYCGFVSGGCTEAAVAAESVVAISKELDRFLRLGEGSPFFDIVLPCGGGINLAIHVLQDSAALRTTVASLSQRRRVSLEYDPGAQQLSAGASTISTGWASGRFVTAYRPRPRIVVCGRSIEVEATARVAAAVGCDTVAYDVGSSKPLGPDLIDADTAVVLLFHDLDLEIPVLDTALAARPFYLGALGSSRTHGRRSEALKARGYSEADIARIKAPIGLFGRARDSRSLALSVLADVAAAYGNVS